MFIILIVSQPYLMLEFNVYFDNFIKIKCLSRKSVLFYQTSKRKWIYELFESHGCTFRQYT